LKTGGSSSLEPARKWPLRRHRPGADVAGGAAELTGLRPELPVAADPLWLFYLAEAETTEGSQRLGQLGSHIVAEFLLGSLRCDEGSVLYAAPGSLQGWGPTATIATNRRHSMPELLAHLHANAKVGGQPIRLFH